MTLAKEPRPLLDDYPQQSGRYDEVVDADGTIRPTAGGAIRALAGRDLEELAVAVERHSADGGPGQVPDTCTVVLTNERLGARIEVVREAERARLRYLLTTFERR